MTTDQRLKGRLELLQDFGVSIDHTNDLIIFHFNRSLDLPITMLKHLTFPRWNTLLTEAQEAYLRYHKHEK